jgi:hypothetical protein
MMMMLGLGWPVEPVVASLGEVEVLVGPALVFGKAAAAAAAIVAVVTGAGRAAVGVGSLDGAGCPCPDL